MCLLRGGQKGPPYPAPGAGAQRNRGRAGPARSVSPFRSAVSGWVGMGTWAERERGLSFLKHLQELKESQFRFRERWGAAVRGSLALPWPGFAAGGGAPPVCGPRILETPARSRRRNRAVGRVWRLGRPSGHQPWFLKHPHSAERTQAGEGAIPPLRGHLGPPPNLLRPVFSS